MCPQELQGRRSKLRGPDMAPALVAFEARILDYIWANTGHKKVQGGQKVRETCTAS